MYTILLTRFTTKGIRLIGNVSQLIDPLEFARVLWPHVYFYDRQREIIHSVVNNTQTFVPAGNELGKDFVAGFLVTYFFLTRKPVRIVTTSAKDMHLRVLWGEIGRFILSSSLPNDRDKKGVLDAKNGGPIVCNHQDLRKIVNGNRCTISYVLGMVASQETIASLQGHHANPDNLEEANDGTPRTMFVVDEASSAPDDYLKMTTSWAKRILVIGNTWPCDNFFKHAVKGKPGTSDKGGDIIDPVFPHRFFRKVIRIKASDSPNVRFGLEQERAGLVPTGELLVPGVKRYDDYVINRKQWDKIEQCVKLDADFYEGAELRLFPPEWLNLSELAAEGLVGRRRIAKGVGIDPAEGGDKTSMTAVDEYGVIECVARKTPDTAEIMGEAMAFMKKHDVEPSMVCVDRGGGGKQLADRLRADNGIIVRTIPFGETLTQEPRLGKDSIKDRKEHKAERYEYLNRRAQMYGEASELMDPSINPWVFAIPSNEVELRRQLGPIPKLYDKEGRLRMLPKNKTNPDSTEKTLTELLGCSPDEADSMVLAIHAMLHKPMQRRPGSLFTSTSK